MIATEIREPGGPDVLVPVERARPEPGPDEVLIEVVAAGVNRADIFQRLGRYPPPPGASDIPGMEVSGTIFKVGPGVDRWHHGDRVCALIAGGGYAEYCVVPASLCLAVPKHVDLVAAAAIPEAAFTVWDNVFERGRLARGEWLLVHGGSSGIGTTAIQIASALGSRVVATAGSAEKCAACERLGAERCFNYREIDFVAAARELTGGRGVDVVLDMVAGEYLPRDLEVLAVEGRLVFISTLGGSKSTIDVMMLMRRRLTVTGSTLRNRPVSGKAAVAAAVKQHVWPLLESGVFKPIIFATFSLRDAAEAHRVMESGEHIGKIVLVVR
jgi:NADPH:quinone reductase